MGHHHTDDGQLLMRRASVDAVLSLSWAVGCGGNPRPFFFFEANVLGSEFHFLLKNNDLFKISGTHVDKTVFLNDSNCHWQSICSGEIVHRASFLMREFCF